MLLGAGDGNVKQTQALAVRGAGVTNLEQVFWQRQKVIVSLAFAPGGMVGSDQKDVFKLETLGFVGGKDLHGILQIFVWARFGNWQVGGFVIIHHGDKVV